MVTVAQLKELNKKIDNLKEQNSAAMAELKVLQGQFDAKAKALSEMLGLQVTAENVETLYMQAQQQLEEKAGKIEELLRDLQGGGQPNAFGHPATGPAGFSTPIAPTGQQGTGMQSMFAGMNPVGFGATPTFNPAAVTPAQTDDGQGVAPTLANFGTGTTFNI